MAVELGADLFFFLLLGSQAPAREAYCLARCTNYEQLFCIDLCWSSSVSRRKRYALWRNPQVGAAGNLALFHCVANRMTAMVSANVRTFSGCRIVEIGRVLIEHKVVNGNSSDQ